jgi:hypothetical protein
MFLSEKKYISDENIAIKINFIKKVILEVFKL